ncbi:succinic semialdehyde dehydrogenase [Rhodococcus erythropolis]|jgi:succinate-semialdehyde dehydrogenase/glutarate-semialdehyde dehydrogenase|uniref:Putative aldehyde dehydrogenase n=1 Tax=Rhodococcus erythropolis (strain PR4 / NBRC 100887) TaxID=234621 RepID=C0ZQ16_RHOE4|nr:succinic semialdehyde dehydrogenase [Rhodococcus erythropolis]BAH31494.1 putative aldehyde dehydrogenase [Rhodococcus erythropolis PR4]
MTTRTDKTGTTTSTASNAPSTAIASDVLARLIESLSGGGPDVSTAEPATGQHLATFRTSTAGDVSTAFTAARKAQRSWAATSPRQRAKPFLRLHDLVLANEGLIDIVQAETGKSRNSAFEETLDVAGLALYYGRHAAKFLAPRRRAGAIPLATQTRELRQPKGVVGIISPWNYPLSLGVCDIIPALLAGNAVVHKPDTQTVLTALRARELLIEAGLAPGLWQIVVGEPETVGQPIIDHADHICFTGSTGAGRKIAEAAASRLIGCTLELGGKNPMLVLDDADLNKAAKGAARACFSTAGQLCLSTERLYIANTIYDEFVRKLVDETRSLRLGKGTGFDYDIGTLTSQRQFDNVERHVTDARKHGATVLAGGRPRADLGPYFYEPTILEGVTPEMEVHSNETFGPVVSLYRIHSDNEAIRLANDTEFGLNASIWTSSTSRGRRVAERIRCGTVNINEGYGSAYASNDAPMGGMKASGQGRRHGEHGILEYTELQTIASQHVVGFDPPPGVSTEQNATILARMYRLMKMFRIK